MSLRGYRRWKERCVHCPPHPRGPTLERLYPITANLKAKENVSRNFVGLVIFRDTGEFLQNNNSDDNDNIDYSNNNITVANRNRMSTDL